MSMEIVRRSLDAALVAPDISPKDAKLLEQMKALDAKDRAARARQAIIEANSQRLAEELKVIGDRVGVPIGRFLAERGVTTATPILDVVPARLSPAGWSKGIGFFGESRENGTNISGLGLEPKDLHSAIVVFNVARRVALGLDMWVIMNDIVTNMFRNELWRPRGISPHSLAILQGAVAQLPNPPQR